jgi:hypothetical protein
MDLSADVDTADTTTFKANWKTHVVGQAGTVVDTEGLYDPTVNDVRDLLDVDLAGSVMTGGPAGLETVGDMARLVLVSTTSYAESASVGDAVVFSWAVLADGTVGFGHCLHPITQEDGDDDGTTFDGIAETTDGAIAHLHVSAVSSGDEIDVLIEDSADGDTWAPVTGGAFATADGIGAERLLIPGTIRRYLRASWDISGPGDQEITFGVALARL